MTSERRTRDLVAAPNLFTGADVAEILRERGWTVGEVFSPELQVWCERAAGLLGSMGSIGDCFDNSVAESFFGSLQLELLDEHRWDTRDQLANAIFDWIECWYNPRRRHSYCQMLSPIDYETATAA